MQKMDKGFYDIDTESQGDSVYWDLCELMSIKNLKQRKLFINYGICQENIDDIVMHILQFNKEDAGIPPQDRKPILLYCCSNGGSVDAGFEVIDAIQASETPVYTINLGYQYSMAFLIGLAGHKRFASKNAKFLMHDGSNFVWDSSTKVQDQVEFQKKVNDRIRSYVLERSKVSPEEYDSKLRVEWYLFADEAKEKGFTDYIIGEDCDLNMII